MIISLSVLILFAAFLIFKSISFTTSINKKTLYYNSTSIAYLEKVSIGGMDQWILVRSDDISNPVLLWLHGGPGSSQMPVSRWFNKELEEEFMVVHWDQRGAGKSNPADFNENTMSVEQFESDAHELTQYLKQRFNKEKIYLLGHSWGTQFGSKVAFKYPEDYYAYIGVSQVVRPSLAVKIGYEWLENMVISNANNKDKEKLQELGPPPYNDHSDFVSFIHMVDKYGGGMDVSFLKLTLIAISAPEYNFSDYFKWVRGSSRGSGPMWETTQCFNLFSEVPSLETPAYFFSGANDYNTPLVLLEEYIGKLEAPEGKELVVFSNSSHAPFMGEPEKFNNELTRVKKETFTLP